MKTSRALSFLDLRRYRWLPHLLVVMTVFALFAGIVLIRFVEQRFVGVTGGELTLAAVEVAEKLDRMLFERRGDVIMLARVVSSRPFDQKFLSEYLKWMKTTYTPVYQSLAVKDAQGIVVAATDPSVVVQATSGVVLPRRE